MKQLLLSIICCLFLSFVHGQGGTKLSITKLHFNSGLEKNLFEAVEKHQPYDPVQLFIIIDSAITEKSIHDAVESVNGFAEQLKGEKPGKTFSKTVQNYFDETHERFFTKYELSAFFNQIFESGTYNCVTASALYAILFDKLGIQYAIKEKPTHVYLIVNPGMENIMVETTDPRGLISGVSDDLKKKYVKFLKAEKLISDKDLTSNSTDDLFYKSYYPDSNISLVQLAGVQYYNKGVTLMNNKDYAGALNAYEKSYRLYPSERTAFLIISCLEQFLGDNFVTTYDQNKEYLVKYVNYTHMEETRQTLHDAFEKVARELLLNQNDKIHYDAFYSYLKENITDSAALSKITFTNFFYLGTAEGLKSNYAKSLTYLKQAAAINPNNLMLQSIVTVAVMQDLTTNDDLEGNEFLDSLIYYSKLFPFLLENNKVQTVFAAVYLQLAGENYNKNKGDAGGKYINSFESFRKEYPDMDVKDDLIGWAYGEESSYYIRKGNKAKAKEVLITGLKYSPDNQTLKTKLSYLKYF